MAGPGNLVQELSGSTPTASLLTGLGIDEVFTRTDGSGMSTLLTDALGSTLELADASGTLQTHYTFDPFGATSVSGAASANAVQFTGRENDGTGLYFNRARFYSPSLQRWMSEDPMEFAAGDVNLYAYVGNQPTIGAIQVGSRRSMSLCQGARVICRRLDKKTKRPQNRRCRGGSSARHLSFQI